MVRLPLLISGSGRSGDGIAGGGIALVQFYIGGTAVLGWTSCRGAYRAFCRIAPLRGRWRGDESSRLATSLPWQSHPDQSTIP